jgi:undecaprenyl-diphosphatase
MHGIPIASLTVPMADPTAIALASWHAVVLGLVVGLTEFLPISSSAHLAVVPVLLGWSDPGLALSAVIELGSSAAVIAYFRHDLVRILRALRHAWRRGDWSAPDARLGLGIALGTLPLLVVGMAFKLLAPDLDHGALRSFKAIGVVSILMAALLGLAEWIGRRRRSLSDLQVSDGVLVGLAQALAVIPGVSRSGSTITTSLLVGLKREDAARFSFLLGIPAVALAGLSEIGDAVKASGSTGVLPLLVGIAVAAISSWCTIGVLLGFLKRHSTWIFVVYRLVFGVVLLGAMRG